VFTGGFVRNNASGDRGGGLCVSGGSSEILGTIIRVNSAAKGGGIAWLGGTLLSISGAGINANTATLGGGLWVAKGATPVEIAGTELCSNSPEAIRGAWTDGGGNDFCPCPADLDGDGFVNSVDLADFLTRWGNCGGGECESADLNRDGLVDAADLTKFLAGWGQCP
jgi:hypothetical protein